MPGNPPVRLSSLVAWGDFEEFVRRIYASSEDEQLC